MKHRTKMLGVVLIALASSVSTPVAFAESTQMPAYHPSRIADIHDLKPALIVASFASESRYGDLAFGMAADCKYALTKHAVLGVDGASTSPASSAARMMSQGLRVGETWQPKRQTMLGIRLDDGSLT